MDCFLAGSDIGGIAETRELLDFCGEHDIISDIKVIKIQDVNEAYKLMCYQGFVKLFSLNNVFTKCGSTKSSIFGYSLITPLSL